jgi:hypothetical protein
MKRLVLAIASMVTLAPGQAFPIGTSIAAVGHLEIRRDETFARPAVCVRRDAMADVFDRCGKPGDHDVKARDPDAANARD